MMFDEDDHVEYNAYNDRYPGVMSIIFLVVVTRTDIHVKRSCSMSYYFS